MPFITGAEVALAFALYSIPISLSRTLGRLLDRRMERVHGLVAALCVCLGTMLLLDAFPIWPALEWLKSLMAIAAAALAGATALTFKKILLALESQAAEKAIALQNANRDLEETRELALAASKAKSEFIATMSHEIRTPLNSIIGMTDLLAESRLDREQREYLRILGKSSQALLSLVSGVLDLSKIESQQLYLESTQFNIRSTITTAIEIASVKASEKGLALSRLIDASVPKFVIGDPLRLQQVLTNLLGNAVKFTSEGSVRIEARVVRRENDVSIVRFCIVDTGIGIPHDKLDQVFSEFVQVDLSVTRQYGGTGLGLAICKKLVELMGGRIWAENEERGSRFIFEIPLREAVPAVEATHVPPPMPLQEPNFNKVRILLAEDSKDNQSVIRAYLKRVPHELTIANDGTEAVERFTEAKFDVVLMDLQMPHMDGYEATSRIREWERESSAIPTPIIALTAFALKEEKDRSLRMGCDLHLTKPITKSTLLDTIQKYGGTGIDPNLPLATT